MATCPPRHSHGTEEQLEKQVAGGGKDAGSGHGRAAGPEATSRECPWAARLVPAADAEPFSMGRAAGEAERLLGAGMQRCLCREPAVGSVLAVSELQ